MAKRVCLYGILTGVCIVLGYLEHFISFDFIAPGIKLGLVNSVVLLLITKKDIKGAFLTNTVRILMSAVLFSSPSVLIYSLPAGIVSTVVMAVMGRCRNFSVIGFSIMGAAVHNIIQLLCAFLMLGKGVLFYSPFLLLAALISGSLIGILVKILSGKVRF